MKALLLYQGVHTLIWHWTAYWFYRRKIFFTARLISQIAKFFVPAEIHPGTRPGYGVLADHGSGVAVGGTTIVGSDCMIYQGVILGGVGTQRGKRHPTLESSVTVGTDVKILGSFGMGDNCTIAASAVLLESLENNIIAMGVPARSVKRNGIHIPKEEKKLTSMEHYCKAEARVEKLEEEVLHLKVLVEQSRNQK